MMNKDKKVKGIVNIRGEGSAVEYKVRYKGGHNEWLPVAAVSEAEIAKFVARKAKVKQEVKQETTPEVAPQMSGKRAAAAVANATGKRTRVKVEKANSATRELGGKQSYRPGQAPKSAPVAEVLPGKQSVPKRDAKGRLKFPDHPEFKPNLTPAQVLQRGSFGGTYFRPIDSGTTGTRETEAWKEFPKEWFEGLDIRKQVRRPVLESLRFIGVRSLGRAL